MAHQAPIHSFDLGEIAMTFIPDGSHRVRAVQQYRGSTPEFWAHHSQYVDEDDWLVMSIGGLLLRTGGKNVLVDLGFGPRAVHDLNLLSPGHHGNLIGGELITNLRKTGLEPDDIDGVIISHLHPDHIGWASAEGADGTRPLMFANADYYVGATEWDYWRSGGGMGTAGAPTPAEMTAMESRLTLLDGISTPFAGLDAMPTPGHTPGHLSFVVSSGEARAIIIGDAIHCPAEISEIELEFAFDVDPKMSRRTKEKIARELESPHTHMVGGHFPDAVFGRVLNGTVDRAYYS